MSFLQNVSNWLLGDYKVRTTKLSDNSLVQHVRLTDDAGDIVTPGGGTAITGYALETTLGTLSAKVPALGQALEAASTPVVLPASQVTTLTPPAAITGFATEATLSTLNSKVTACNTGAVVISGALPAGAANIGDVDVLTVPTDPFGVNADAASATGSISAKLRFIAATGIPITGTVTVGSHAVTNAGTFLVQPNGQAAHDVLATGLNPNLIGGYASAAAPTDVSGDGDSVRAWHLRNGAQACVLTAAGALIGGDASNGLDVDVTRVGGTVTVGGDVAHDGADSGSPVKCGGQARTTNPTAVVDADRVNFIADKLGKQIVVGAIRDLKGVTQTSISASTSETTIIAAVASTFMDLYGLILANTGATTTKVTIKDATAGTTRAVIEVPTLETRGFMLPVDSAIPQATVNNNWTATCASSTTALEVTALWVKNI